MALFGGSQNPCRNSEKHFGNPENLLGNSENLSGNSQNLSGNSQNFSGNSQNVCRNSGNDFLPYCIPEKLPMQGFCGVIYGCFAHGAEYPGFALAGRYTAFYKTIIYIY
jgi:hypothetical protein